MTSGLKTIIYPVNDLGNAKAVFGALLGRAPVGDQPYYAYFEDAGLHIGLNPNGHAQGMTGPLPYWHVGDIAATIDALTAAGATLQQAPTDVGGGRLVASLTDADGNPIGLIQDA